MRTCKGLFQLKRLKPKKYGLPPRFIDITENIASTLKLTVQTVKKAYDEVKVDADKLETDQTKEINKVRIYGLNRQWEGGRDKMRKEVPRGDIKRYTMPVMSSMQFKVDYVINEVVGNT